MSLPEQVDSTREILRASGFLSAIVAFVHGWRRGTVLRLWDAFIGFLAAPVERDLAKREAKTLLADNLRLSTENDFLRGELYKEQHGTGYCENEDGTPTLHSSSLIWVIASTAPPSLTLSPEQSRTESSTMIDWIQGHSFRVEQILFLGAMGMVLVIFGLAVYAQQIRRGVRPTWPLPGGFIGGSFLISVGMLPMMMATLRLNLFDWYVYGWQQTLVYFLISVIAISTMVRWWRKGLDDSEPWDGIRERRSGKDRRTGSP